MTEEPYTNPPNRHEERAYGRFGKSRPKVIVKKQPHGQVVNTCIQWLFAHGVFCWPNRTGEYTKTYRRADGTVATYTIPYGKKGSGDILGVNRHGIHVEVEAKCRETGDTQRLDQSDHQHRIEEKKGIYIVAYGPEELDARKDEILNRGAP